MTRTAIAFTGVEIDAAIISGLKPFNFQPRQPALDQVEIDAAIISGLKHSWSRNSQLD